MKRSEAYIEKISKQFKISPATAKVLYDAINKYDQACFCSYMADSGDKPGERVAAEKELNRVKNQYSTEFQKVINNIQSYMKSDTEYNIHEMDKEV
jgi:hypothetical protein